MRPNNENKYNTAHLSSESIANLQHFEKQLRDETGEDIVLIAYADRTEQQSTT